MVVSTTMLKEEARYGVPNNRYDAFGNGGEPWASGAYGKDSANR